MEKNNKKYTPSKLRYALFPFKVLSLISLLGTATFIYAFYCSKLFNNLSQNQLFFLKIGIFLSFFAINIIVKSLQAAISYKEIKKAYLVDKTLKIAVPTQQYINSHNRYIDALKLWNDNPEKEEARKPEKPRARHKYVYCEHNNFSKSQKIKYFSLVSTGLISSTLFVTPFLLESFAEKYNFLSQKSLNILNNVCKYLYIVTFFVLTVTFLVIHSIQTSMRMQCEYWPALDNSIEQQKPLMCILSIINKFSESIVHLYFNNNFISKFFNKQNKEENCLEHIFTILSRNFVLSDAIFFSSGKNKNENFSLISQ
jgi:hypothetical protein